MVIGFDSIIEHAHEKKQQQHKITKDGSSLKRW